MQAIDSLLSVADHYDVIVFDQFGVLHNGSTPYPAALETLEALQSHRPIRAVLSNSGKSAAVNRDRITAMGFDPKAFGVVMTSGEALWQDIAAGALLDVQTLFPIEAKSGDALIWARDLDVSFCATPETADALLLMGLPDGSDHADITRLLDQARSTGKLLICSNPDRASPRADGGRVVSPGALAHAYADAGGRVAFYGKPYLPIFEALCAQIGLGPKARFLMVGDSPEHDIAGAAQAGWDSLFITGGLHAGADPADLFQHCAKPTYTLDILR